MIPRRQTVTKSKCPVCGREKFYVKDPEDEYEFHEFECRDGRICFAEGKNAAGCPEIHDRTEIFCNTCSWHDSLAKLR